MWDFSHPETSEERFRAALAGARGDDAPILRTQLARAMALQRRFDEAAAELDAVAAHGDLPPEAKVRLIPWAERALAIAETSADPRVRKWAGSVTHNLGWTMHDLGRYDEALAQFERALALREQQGDAELIRVARWTVARALRSLGRTDEALEIQRALAEAGPEDGFVSEELGELLLAQGRPEEARPHFARAHALLSHDAWLADAEPDRLRRLADLAGPPG